MKWVMLPVRDSVTSCDATTNNQSSNTWLYLSVELLMSIGISVAIAFLRLIKNVLPTPPKSLKNNVVLVAGVNSSLGSCLAEEFAKGGCCVICVDTDLKSAETIASQIRTKYHAVQNIGPDYRKQDRPGSTTRAYECDLYERADIQTLARKVRDEVGRVDVLVTCMGEKNYNIFDAVSKTLMGHYWTIMSFLPTILLSENPHIIGIIPNGSVNDAYAGSKAAIAGLIESLADTIGCQNKQLNFIAVSPKTKISNAWENDQKIAKNIVEAVQMGQQSLQVNYISRIFYRISCAISEGLNFVTRYIET